MFYNNKKTWEGDGDALDASERFQGVACLRAEKLFEEIRSVAADQSLQEARRLFHRGSFRCVEWMSRRRMRVPYDETSRENPQWKIQINELTFLGHEWTGPKG